MICRASEFSWNAHRSWEGVQAGFSSDRARRFNGLALASAGDKTARDIDTVKAELALARKAQEIGEAHELQARVESNPDDYQARCDLAIALNASGDRDGAAEQLLEIIAKNRAWNDGAAKAQLLQLFEAWGNDDAATASNQARRLSWIHSPHRLAPSRISTAPRRPKDALNENR